LTINYTPRTWVAGETVTAAFMNTEIRDAFTGVQAAWTAYTPTWTASVNPVLGNGTLVGAHLRLGKFDQFRIQLTMGSTTSFGTGSWLFAIPAATHAAYTGFMHVGNGAAVDVSASALSGLTAVWNTSTTLFGLTAAGTAPATGVPWAWAVGDKISFSCTLELA